MAFPVIRVNSATGSDTTASGAGPDTAVSGSSAVTNATGVELRDNPDLSGVLTDGSHALFVNNTTAGQRNFTRITGVRNTTSTTGTMTASNVDLSLPSEILDVGDYVSVAGAGLGGTDLVTSISTNAGGGQYTTIDAAETSVTNAVVTYYKKVNVAETVTAATISWAIGGRRASIGSTTSIKLFSNNSSSGDAMPGWIVRMESGHTETLSANYLLRRAGDVTNGYITLEGAKDAATMPIITFSNNGDGITLNAAKLTIQNFEIRNSNATKTASRAIVVGGTGQSSTIRNIRVSHATNKFWKAFVASHIYILEDCDFANTASDVITDQIASTANRIVRNCRIRSGGANGILANGSRFCMTIEQNDIYGNSSHGISLASTGNLVNDQLPAIRNNTIHGNTGDGIRNAGSSTQYCNHGNFIYENNNITSNGGYAINFTGASITDDLLFRWGVRFRNNNTGTGATANTSGVSNITLTTTGIDNITVDPDYTDAANGDFSVGTSVKDLAYPTAVKAGTSPARSYVDIGSYQREESSVGGGTGTVFNVME